MGEGPLEEDDASASQGIDLLSLALGRGGGPGATDLDEFVEFEVFFDGTARASEAGEAVPFLRARLCQAFELLSADLGKYLWHRDRFTLEVDLGGGGPGEEPKLTGHLRTGDGVEDEWFAVYLLRRLTAALPDAACRVVDADGELLLIEAALAAPRWLTPANAEHRCWLRGGKVHLLPRPQPPEPQRLPKHEALAKLRSAAGATVAKDKVQAAIDARLEGYPKHAAELSRHVARAVLPVHVARMLVAYPQLVAVAVDHLPLPPARDLLRYRRQLPEQEASVHLDCEGPPAQETACIGVRLTRCQYARLLGLRCQLPQRFTARHWRPPPGEQAEEKAMHLGAALSAGLEAAYLQGTKSATSVLRWPTFDKGGEELLPAVLPWSADAAFSRHAAELRPPVDPSSASCRRAFLQQSALEERFQAAFLRAIRDEALAQAVDLKAHWRDRNDAEDWLDVSEEELEREMGLRQAEFDAYDRRRAASKADAAAAAAAGGRAEEVQKELASMGRELSGLLERASCHEGVDADAAARGSRAAAFGAPGGTHRGPAAERGGGGDSDDSSEVSGSEELDVLGLEDEDEDASGSDEDDAEEGAGGTAGRGAGGGGGGGVGGGMRDYYAELDEQLSEELDGGLPLGEAAGPGLEAGGLPLSSRHVKVHDAGPVELDVHAMEHMLASYCAEHQMAPGPASLLLRELGLAGGGGPAGPRQPPHGLVSSLDTMD